MEWTNENLIKLGMATAEVKRRVGNQPDSRGWNKCLETIWTNYNDLVEKEIDEVLNEN